MKRPGRLKYLPHPLGRRQDIEPAATCLPSDPSRRAIPGAVSAAALATGAVAAAVASPAEADPVFAAIEKHRQAEAEFRRLCGITEEDERQAAGRSEEEAQTILDAVFDGTDQALATFATTVPQSKVGIRAALHHFLEFVDRSGCLMPEEEAKDLMRSILASPALSGDSVV